MKEVGVIELRKQLKQTFASAGIDCCDADFIFAEVLGVKHTELSFVKYITPKQAKKIKKLASLRLKHMPINKIFKKGYFYGYQFKINNHVLAPRQDSEIVVEKALELIKENNLATCLDLCCGSGCLAVAIKLNSNVNVQASDVGGKALKIAKFNAKNLGADIKFVKSNMFKNISDSFDLIVSNPPYIESEVVDGLDFEVKKFDPRLALDGGADGLNYYREIERVINRHLNVGGYLVLEIGYNQRLKVLEIFKNLKFINCYKDYGGQDRVMIFRREV